MRRCAWSAVVWFSPTVSLRTLPAWFRQAARDNLTSAGVRASEAYPGHDDVASVAAESSADVVVLFGKPAECTAVFETIAGDQALRVAVARSVDQTGKRAKQYGADAVIGYAAEGKVDATMLAPQLRALLDPLADGFALEQAYAGLVADDDDLRRAAASLLQGELGDRIGAARAASGQRGASDARALLLALERSAAGSDAAEEQPLREALLDALSWHEHDAVHDAFGAAVRHEPEAVFNAVVGMAWRQEKLVRGLDKLARELGDSKHDKAILDRLYRIEAAQ